MTLVYQGFTAMVLFYGSLFLSGFYYCVCVLDCRRENVGARIRALSEREFLASKQVTVLDHPPYSPDLVPSDFSVPEYKENIERKTF
jgi:hypothetical protein